MNDVDMVSPAPVAARSKRAVAARESPVTSVVLAPSRRAGDAPASAPAPAMTTRTADQREIDAALARGDLAEAANKTLELLADQAGRDDPTIHSATRVITAYRALMETLPPLHQVARHKIHFDDRAAVCFEQLITLLRHQDAQIAELQAILLDLV